MIGHGEDRSDVDGRQRLGSVVAAWTPTLVAARSRREDARQDGEDVVAEAVARAIESGTVFESEEHCRRWLSVTSRRIAIDNGRRRGRVRQLTSAAEAHVADIDLDPALLAVRSAEAANVHRVLGGIPGRDAEMLWRRDAEGWDVADLAVVYGVTPGSMRVLLSRARSRFREEWDVAKAGAVALVLRVQGWPSSARHVVEAAALVAVVAVGVTSGVLGPVLGGDGEDAVQQPVLIAPAGARPPAVTAPIAPMPLAVTETRTVTRAGGSTQPPEAASIAMPSPEPTPTESRTEVTRIDTPTNSVIVSNKPRSDPYFTVIVATGDEPEDENTVLLTGDDEPPTGGTDCVRVQPPGQESGPVRDCSTEADALDD